MYNITPVLQSLGFLDSEIKTYLSALEHGPGTVLDLTKKTHFSRQATYAVIESLTKRGLMSSVLRGKKKYFVAEDPEKLLAYAERREVDIKEKVGDLKRALPELKLKASGDRPVIRLYEGKESVLAVLNDLADHRFKEGNVILYEIEDIDTLFNAIDHKDFIPVLQKLKRFNIKAKGFYQGTPRGKTLDSIRYFLPPDVPKFKTSVTMYGNKIIFHTFEGKINTIVIESQSLANTLRVLFELGFKAGELQHFQKD
ncbi:hypothetical protein HYW94_01270 [Candidatus Uhrbacteria bacterium]|nr:hypothetical protein [Candidatus Uhrbacteria bacterium]